MSSRPSETSAVADPSQIMKITRGDCAAQVLYAALDARLFDVLERPGPANDTVGVAAAAGVDEAFCGDVLDVLVGLGLLDQGSDGAYANTDVSRRYLVRSSGSYLGDFLEIVRGTIYDTWSRLPEALRTGAAQTSDPDKGGFNGRTHRDPARMRSFLTGLDAVSDAIAGQLAGGLQDMTSPVILDVGGARGHLAARLQQHVPGSRAVVFDLDRTRPLFEDHMTELGAPSTVSFVDGDFCADRLPGADVAVLGHILHGLGAGERALVLRQVAQAVRPGGRVLVYDRMVDQEHRSADELLGSLHMRLVSSAGSEYSAAECMRWLAAAGFSSPGQQSLVEGYTLVSAQR